MPSAFQVARACKQRYLTEAWNHVVCLNHHQCKGGCGKTTVALNHAVCFARAGYRTLAIDLDQQGNLSAVLGVDLNRLNSTAHRLLIKEIPEIRRYLVEVRPQLHLLPNSIDIEAAELLEEKKVNRELLLRRQLKPILPDFDVIIIDTPPAMRAATVNALVVADSVIIPIDSSSFALLGMNQLLKTIAAISETHNPSLKILVLTTMINEPRRDFAVVLLTAWPAAPRVARRGLNRRCHSKDCGQRRRGTPRSHRKDTLNP